MAQEHDLPGTPRQTQISDPPGSELRSAPRFALLIRTAKIIADGREFLCIIRDASASGIKIRLFTALPEAREIFVEQVNGDRYPVDVVWQTDDYAGLQFRKEIAVEQLLDEGRGSLPRRQVRLRIALDGILRSGGEAVRVGFKDISQQGACVECDKWLLMNELVRVETGVTPALYAKVRWRSHPRYGLIFEHTFKLDELARISAPLQLAQALEQYGPQTGAADGELPAAQPPV